MASEIVYTIDSSALIDGWRRYYPPDVLPSLWDRLEETISSNRLIAPIEVKLELGRVEDGLHEWVSNRDTMFVDTIDESQDILREIVDRFPQFIPERSPDGIWADPYVIALAKETNSIVVTGEKKAPANARGLKIPNVCQALGIEYMTLLDLIRNEKWRF